MALAEATRSIGYQGIPCQHHDPPNLCVSLVYDPFQYTSSQNQVGLNWHRRSVARCAVKAEAVGAVAGSQFPSSGLFRIVNGMPAMAIRLTSTAQRLSAGCPEVSLLLGGRIVPRPLRGGPENGMTIS